MEYKIHRRNFVKSMGVAALAATSFSRAGYGQTTKPELSDVQIIGVRDPQLGMQLAVADYLSLFKQEGLNVSIAWQQSSGDLLNIMGGGSPIGTGNPLTQIILAARGIPARMLCAFADIAGGQGVVLAPGVHLNSPKEMEGKKCAFTEGANNPLILSGLAKRYGFDVSKIHMINMEPSEGVVAASRGDVDMLLSWQPFLYRLQQLKGTLYATGDTLYFTNPPEKLSENEKLLHQHSALVVRDDWVKAHPLTMQALLRALIKAEHVFFSDRAKAMDALQKTLKVPDGPLQVMATTSRYRIAISPELADTYVRTVQWAMDNHRITQRPDTKTAFDVAPLLAVDASRVTWQAGS